MWVLGSGATMDYVDPGFFDGKHVIAVNRAGERLRLYDRLPTLATVTHYIYEDVIPLAEAYPDHHFYAPIHDQGFAHTATGPALPNVTYYPHRGTDYAFTPEPWDWPDDGLIMGSTSMHAAMHLACRMGAANVILVGADCGLLDDKTNHGAYQSGNLTHQSRMDFLARWDEHLRLVKDVLVECYGVRVHSLNPFVNPNMEGHTWTSLTARRA